LFRKSVEKIQLSLKSDKNKGYLHEDQYTFFIKSRSFLLRMRNQTKVVEKIETHILFSVTVFYKKSCRLWENVEKYCRAG